MNDRQPVRRRGGKAGDTVRKPARLTPEIQSRIGDRLRAMYDDVVSQGVPDRFATLLQQLDRPADEKKE